jgi:uncharacterized protein (DUF697 family)
VAADGYLPPLVTELKADVSGLGKGIEEAKRMVKKYKDDVDDLGDGFRKTKTDADGAGKAVSDFERLVRSKMRTGENAVSAMRTEWERLQKLIKDTKSSLAKGGGDSGGDFDVLRTLTKDAALLGGIASDFGIRLADATGKGIANGAAASGPYVQTAIATAIVGAVVIAAPVIGGAIATAVTLALGLGIIGLAAYILKEDPKIKKAWEKLTDTTSGVFERAAKSMKKPFIEALNFFRKEFPKLEPTIAAIFKAAGPLVMPLAEGMFGLVANMLPGLLDAVINAGPAFEEFGKGLPLVGSALGEFFKIITENKEGIALFTADTMSFVAKTILVLGYIIAFLTDAYVWIRKVAFATDEALSAVGNTLLEWYTAAKTWIKNLFNKLGQDIMSGMVAGIKWKATAVKNEIVDAVKSAWEAAKGFLQTGSPSKLYMELGKYTVQGYAKGIDVATPDAWASLKRMTVPGAANPAVAAAAVPSTGGRGSQVDVMGVAHIYLDGREIQQAGIKYAQRDKVRNTTSGWS